MSEMRWWIPIRKQLPEAGRDVLVTSTNDEWEGKIVIGVLNVDGRWTNVESGRHMKLQTHWMPLPKRPHE